VRARTRLDILNLERELERNHRLTPLEEYFVIGMSFEYLRVINDIGEPILYSKYLFEIVDHKIPPDWEFREFGDSAYYLDPIAMSTPGFYGEYFNSDGDLQAQHDAQVLFIDVLQKICKWSQGADLIVVERDLLRVRKAIAIG
jgi:hypothetical protein